MQEAESMNRAAPPDRITEARRPIRILLVEADPENQKLISHILEKEGYLCEIVKNGQEVLDKLEREEYDLVLMNLQLPMYGEPPMKLRFSPESSGEN